MFDLFATKRFVVFTVGFWLAISADALGQVSKDSRLRYRDRNGKEEAINGVIRKETLTEITIKPTNGIEKRIPTSSIIDIEYAPPSFAIGKELRAARTMDASGNVDQAIRQLQVLLPQLSDPALNRHTEFTIARMKAQHAAEGQDRLKAAIEALTSFQKKHPESWQVITVVQTLVPLQVQAGDRNGAQAALRSLSNTPGISAAQRVDCQVKSAQLLSDENKFADAEQTLQTLIKSLPTGEPSILRARVALAEIFAASNRVADAVKELESVIDRANAPDVKAFAYNALGDCLRRAGEPRKAMWNYLFVDVLYNQDKQEHARALFNLYQVFKELKDDKKAQQFRQMLENNKELAGDYQIRIRQEK